MEDVNALIRSQAIIGVPRCLECNKLYKKSEANEHGLCRKCLTEKYAVLENTLIEEEVKVKPGQIIRKAFLKLVAGNKETEVILSILTDQVATFKELGVRYAFLKEFNPDVPIKELTYVKSHARYSSKPIDVNGKRYLVTNDLYSKDVPKFLAWIKQFD